MTEKRSEHRFDADQQIWCEGQNVAHARNMSRSGMFIVTDRTHQIGEEIDIAFAGTEGSIQVKAEVIWRGDTNVGDDAGVGLRIVSFEHGEDAYDRFVKLHLQTQGRAQPR